MPGTPGRLWSLPPRVISLFSNELLTNSIEFEERNRVQTLAGMYQFFSKYVSVRPELNWLEVIALLLNWDHELRPEKRLSIHVVSKCVLQTDERWKYDTDCCV